MIVIDISELKKFLQSAKNIKDRNILPILSYIKLECKGGVAKLTKTNLDSFVTSEVEAAFKGEHTVLIDEKTLSATVAYSETNLLSISVDGSNVILDDGVKKNRCKVENSKLFPAIESNDLAEKTVLSTEFISSLSTAKNHTVLATERIRWECFVHVLKSGTKTLVGGANGMILYLKTFNEQVPAMSLSPDTISAISGLHSAEYSSSGRYDFFQFLGTTYGFIKPEIGQPDLSLLLDRLKTDSPLTVSRKELISFCEMVISMNGSSIIPEVSLKTNKDELMFCFDGAADAQGSERKVKAIGDIVKFPSTIFQPRNLLVVMKDLGTDTVNLSKISGNIVVTTDEDKDYKGSIMELAPLN